MWVNWTDPGRNRLAPVDDDIWMMHKFRFVDENGADQFLSGADVLDTQFQLGYRYDDDPARAQRLDFNPGTIVVRNSPNLPPMAAIRPQAGAAPSDARATAPVVLARGGTVKLIARESAVVLSAIQPGPAGSAAATSELHIVLNNVVAPDRSPPYDVFLLSATASDPSARTVRIGALDLFGGAGQGGHDHGAQGGDQGDTIALDVSEAVAEFARTPGFDIQRLHVSIRRRAFPNASGGEFIPDDPDPPQIGSVELIGS
jgi:hypothetical protein